MNRIYEILRLKHDLGLSVRRIAKAVALSPTTVQKVLKACKAQGISWPPDEHDDMLGLEHQLFPKPDNDSCAAQVDYAEVREQLRRKGVTLKLLWQEHRAAGYRCGYSQFCDDYRKWRKHKQLSMRQYYEPGEYVFVDFSGLTVKIGTRTAQIFVAVLGASCYTFAYAVWTQNLGDWLKCLTRMLMFFDGCPKVIRNDNLKSAVKHACRYDPDYNGTYLQWAEYYGICVFATRPYKAKDKSLAENGVKWIQQQVLAPWRDHSFSSITELNLVLREGVAKFNEAPFSNRPDSRKELFETLDKPALKALRQPPFELADVRIAKVGIDYHCSYQGHWYSVPFEYVHQQVEVHATYDLVTIFFKRDQIAQHPRAKLNDTGKTTCLNHMPKAHQAVGKWTPGTVTAWAADIGPDCERWVCHRINDADHFAKVSRLCIGVLSLSTKYGKTRLNLALRLANRHRIIRLATIKEMLEDGRDIELETRQLTLNLPQCHENLRGANHFK